MLNAADPALHDSGTSFLLKVLDTLASYVGERNAVHKPVQGRIRPDELRKIIPFDKDGICFHDELLGICGKILENSTQTQHPYFVSQLYGRADCYGLAADMIVSALNTNVHVYDLSPVLTLVEKSVIGYLSRRFHLSNGDDFGDGVFVPGASTGTQYALHSARHWFRPECKEGGNREAGRLVAFCSEAAHYSCTNSAMLLGIGSRNMRKIACDQNGRMLVGRLREEIEHSRAVGEEPFCVVATAGTTVLGSFDPINEIADLANEYNLWLHVDAAWGGASLLSAKHEHYMSGVGRADSLVFNAHKILGLPIQCSALLMHSRHGDILADAISIHAPYLHQADRVKHEENLDISKKTFQCGRKGDALKFWMLRKAVGDEGISERVDSCVDGALVLAEKIRERGRRDGSFILKSSIFATTCFWYVPSIFRKFSAHDDPKDFDFDLASVAPGIKEYMLANGYNCMLGYADAPNAPTFFRWAMTNPPLDRNFIGSDLDVILDSIEEVGERIFGEDN